MRRIQCPQCGAGVIWKEAKSRPFCSERCRLIDLGSWLDERYVIPGEPGGVPDDDGDESS
ncbi:MAG: DNA gyrase inhibitor YacG [Candidatus Binatia bacterium]|nr:DNA gyrase inhibitor YacG [Candidatus Binatia bacterium]